MSVVAFHPSAAIGIWLLGALLTGPVVVPAAAADEFRQVGGGYTLYVNERYGTFIEYPDFALKPQQPPANGDGRTFVSQDGRVTLRVWAHYNALEQGEREMMADDEQNGGYDSVTYRHHGTGWYVLSGYAGGDIFYRRVLVNPDETVHAFEITYPVEFKRQFDSVVKHMVGSFGPGSGL